MKYLENINKLASKIAKNNNHKMGFTLAEVLIVIGIIGVVAAITMPTLITEINKKVHQQQINVAEKRFIEGLNMYNSMENGLTTSTYRNTEEFVRGLSKYFKMIQICSADKLYECFPYANINYETVKTTGFVPIERINLDELRLKSDTYFEPAAFISASGIPYIITIKKNCISDPDLVFKTYPECISGMYDYSGAKSPNKFGDDIKPFGDAVLKEALCIYKPNGVCMSALPFKATKSQAGFAGSNCQALQRGEEVVDSQGLFGKAGEKVKVTNSFTGCPNSYDYWLASKLNCELKGYQLPTGKQLAQLAADLYGYSGNADDLTVNWSYTGQLGDVTKYGFTLRDNSGIALWSRAIPNANNSYSDDRNFDSNKTYRYGNFRDFGYVQAFCVPE